MFIESIRRMYNIVRYADAQNRYQPYSPAPDTLGNITLPTNRLIQLKIAFFRDFHMAESNFHMAEQFLNRSSERTKHIQSTKSYGHIRID